MPGTVALAGSSRFTMGLDIKTLRDHFPDRRIAQLSLNGGSPLWALRDLADDAHFRGTVICEVLPHVTYTNIAWNQPWEEYRKQPWSQCVEAAMHVYVSEKTNLLLPDLALNHVVAELVKHRALPSPGFVHFDQDRQGRMDFSRIDPAVLASMRDKLRADYASTGVPLQGAAFVLRVAEIRRVAEQIRQRGGQVLFFRMLSSTPIREIESTRFPDPIYWDVFCQRINFPCLNYADVPGLGDFTCPEGTHLDQSAAPAFTSILADALVGRDLLR